MNNTPLNTNDLKLYHFMACPYCARVRNEIQQLGLDLELRDIHNSREFYSELVSEGGKSQVPALRIQRNDETATWLYESDDIIRFLRREFGNQRRSTAA